MSDVTVPDDFKEFVKAQDMTSETVSKVIDNSPRMLFDVFDEHKVYIQINVRPNFSYSINEGDIISGSWETRIEAETSAIEQSFTILEAKL